MVEDVPRPELQPKPKCDVDDILCQFQVLNLLEGMENLLGTEKFQESFPEFTGMGEIVKERMSEQRETLQETMARCGIDTSEFVKEEETITVSPKFVREIEEEE